MADVKISALPSAAALTGVEEIPVVQSSTTVKTTPAAVATYTATLTQTLTGVPTWSLAEPRLLLNETDQASNEKLWDIDVSAKILTLRTRTDADGAGVNALAVTRGTGTALAGISLGNATDNTLITIPGTGGVLTTSYALNGTGGAPNLGMAQSAASTLVLRASGANQFTLSAAALTIAPPITSQGLLTANVGINTRKGSVTISGTERVKVGGVSYTNTTTTGNTAATETDAFSHSITGATLGTDGESLRFEAAGTFAATASVDKRVKVVFGGTTLFDTGALAVTGGADWRVAGTIIRTGAATQKAIVQFSSSFASLNSSVDYTTPAETLSGAITMKLTVNGTNANDTVAEFYKEEWLPFQ